MEYHTEQVEGAYGAYAIFEAVKCGDVSLLNGVKMNENYRIYFENYKVKVNNFYTSDYLLYSVCNNNHEMVKWLMDNGFKSDFANGMSCKCGCEDTVAILKDLRNSQFILRMDIFTIIMLILTILSLISTSVKIHSMQK